MHCIDLSSQLVKPLPDRKIPVNYGRKCRFFIPRFWLATMVLVNNNLFLFIKLGILLSFKTALPSGG